MTDLHKRDNELRVSFRFDPDQPPVTPERIEALVWELQISAWEMNRTHWAVKEASLLDVLSGPVSAAPETLEPPYAPVTALETFTQLVGERGLDAVERAVRDAIEKNEPADGLDRLHTFATRFLRAVCQERGIATPRDKPLHSLFGEYSKKLRSSGDIESEMTERILKSSISVMDSFSDVRNNQSLAHDNPLLNHNEALLIFNHVINSLRFVQELERLLRQRDEPPGTTGHATPPKKKRP